MPIVVIGSVRAPLLTSVSQTAVHSAESHIAVSGEKGKKKV